MGLEKATKYSLQVATVTATGVGLQSQIVNCSTAEDLPEAPRDIKAVSASHKSVLIAWLPPLNTNGLLTQYTVYVKDVNMAVVKSFPVSEKKNSFSVHALSGSYNFWVTASTSEGEGPASRIVTQLYDGSLVTLNQNFVVAEGGDVSLPCRAAPGSSLLSARWQLGNKYALQMPLSNQPDMEHRIPEVARGDDGEWICFVKSGDFGEDSVVHRVTVVWPFRPPILRYLSSSPDSIVLKLDQPSLGFSTISPATTFHVVQYREPHGSQIGEWKKKEIDAGVSEVLLNSLRCGTLYEISATSHSPHGSGNSSPILTARTNGGPPVGPRSDVFANSFLEPDSTSVVLHMAVWDDGGCPLTDVDVEIKLWEESEWQRTEPVMVSPVGDFLVEELSPDRWYSIKVGWQLL